MVEARNRLKIKQEKLAVVQNAVIDMNVKRTDDIHHIINLDEGENLLRLQDYISSDEEDDYEDKSGSGNDLSVNQFDLDEGNNTYTRSPQPSLANAVLIPNADAFDFGLKEVCIRSILLFIVVVKLVCCSKYLIIHFLNICIFTLSGGGQRMIKLFCL